MTTTTEPNQALSPHETDVAYLIADGLTNKQIAEELDIAVDTVKTLVARIFEKLGVNNRAKVAVWVTLGGLQPRTGEA